jgi:Uma2 family endonuclease
MATQATLPRTGNPRPRMTYEEYRRWLEETGEHTRAEWVDGEVIELMSVKGRHALVFGFVFLLLKQLVEARRYGLVLSEPFEMRILDGRSARQPDIFVVLNEHMGRYSDERLEGPADLVIEIVSEGSVAEDIHVKRREYEEAGILEYWIVEGRLGVSGFEMLRLNEAGYYERVQPDGAGRLHSRVLPGCWIDPDWLARDPLPDPDVVIEQIAPGILAERAERARRALGTDPDGRS